MTRTPGTTHGMIDGMITRGRAKGRGTSPDDVDDVVAVDGDVGIDGVHDHDLVGPRSERDLRRFEAYCRFSLHTLILAMACGLLTVAVIGAWGSFGPGSTLLTTGVVLVSLGWAGTGMAVLDRLCREAPVSRNLTVAFVLCAALVTFGFDLLFPTDADWSNGAAEYVGFGPLGLAGSAAIASAAVRLRAVVLGSALALAGMAALYVVGPAHLEAGGTTAQVVTAFWLTVLCVPAVLATRWMIDVVRRLWRSRQVAADLAVAEERLRFSRDLHDVFGRTLSTVTVKSELAAELARRGDARAVAEMEAVREIAQTALTDVRGLVRGYRSIDFGGELAGARAVLRAAGLRATVTGTPDVVTERVSPRAAEALAWVVREGVTNVLRHGRGGDVRLAVADEGDAVTLTIANAARPGISDGRGSGLIGLRERLEAVGGTVHTGRDGDVFRLHARVPAQAGPSATMLETVVEDEEVHP